MIRAWSEKGKFLRRLIFTRFSKFFRLGLSKRGIFLSKTYFSYLTNNRNWTGKQKQRYIALAGQLPGKAFWLTSNYNQISLSDYPGSGLNIEGVSPKSRHTFMPTLNTSNSRTTTKAFLIYKFYDFTVWKRGIKNASGICLRLHFVKEWVKWLELFPWRWKVKQTVILFACHT